MQRYQNNLSQFLKPFITFVFLFFSAGIWAQNKANVHFKTDISTLSTQEKEMLDKLYKFDLSVATSIELIGHTDADGSDAYNAILSQKRVNEVKKRLIELGNSSGKISIAARGESSPLNTNKNESEKKQNRRVEIKWQKPAPIAASSIQDLYGLLEQQKQNFCINPKRDTFLILDQGTLIFVPAGSFKTSSSDCITLKAKEVYKYSDMVLENLSTMSNDRILETAGMVYTEAWDQNGNQVVLNDDAQITIMIPADTLRDDMGLFTGGRDRETNQISWTLIGDQSNFSTYDYGHDIGFCDSSSYVPPLPKCERCGLFCRIGRLGRTLKGATNKNIKEGNKEFRACQKELKGKGDKRRQQSYVYPYYCDDLMNSYGVTTYEELRDTLKRLEEIIMQAEFEKYGVTSIEAYNDTIVKLQIQQEEQRAEFEKRRFEQTSESLDNGTGSSADLKYYVAKVSTLGWINCDAFRNFLQKDKIDMVTDVPFNDYYDCKLIFRDLKSIMKPGLINKYYGYRTIPPNQDVWLMALKYEQGQAYISLHETTTRKKAPTSEFRAVSIQELREELKILDR